MTTAPARASTPAPRGSSPALRGLALGLAALAVAACSSPPPPTFDLAATSAQPRRSRSFSRQLAVLEPRAAAVLDGDRLIVRAADGSVSALPGAQWSERLPRLVQLRLVQAFENAGGVAAVALPGDRIVSTLALNAEIRAFEVRAAEGVAVVELTLRLVGDRDGRVIAARIITTREPITTLDGPNAAMALDRAFNAAVAETIRWIDPRV